MWLMALSLIFFAMVGNSRVANANADDDVLPHEAREREICFWKM